MLFVVPVENVQIVFDVHRVADGNDDIEVYSQNVDVFYGKGVLGSSNCQ